MRDERSKDNKCIYANASSKTLLYLTLEKCAPLLPSCVAIRTLTYRNAPITMQIQSDNARHDLSNARRREQVLGKRRLRPF
jgi:hypothetical protein